MALFKQLVSKIRHTYRDLDHHLGWRFLYSSRETLKPSTEIIFVGLNPGGKEFEKPQASCESGNAYRSEKWNKKPPSHNALQEQVCLLYEGIAKAIHSQSRDKLMDESLAGNFIPFRSQSIPKLDSPDPCRKLAREIWSSVLDYVKPRLVITMGREVTDEIVGLIEEHATVAVPTKRKTGWGEITYDLRRASLGGHRTLIIGLPHLSRFRIFGRKEAGEKFQPMWNAIRKAMSEVQL